MHETDAMDFIELALTGFLSRQFTFQEGEDPNRYEPHLEKIKDFIQDKESYWVKEKALYYIGTINQAENDILAGRYTPTSPEAFVNATIDRTREMLEKIVNHCRIEQNICKVNVPMFLPSLHPSSL